MRGKLTHSARQALPNGAGKEAPFEVNPEHSTELTAKSSLNLQAGSRRVAFKFSYDLLAMSRILADEAAVFQLCSTPA